ncbi:MAG: hypothetical protein IH884_02205 [Myxococcales bacterium]|nr:hypothetical protein [Myxococcales bacterium]
MHDPRPRDGCLNGLGSLGDSNRQCLRSSVEVQILRRPDPPDRRIFTSGGKQRIDVRRVLEVGSLYDEHELVDGHDLFFWL